MYAMYSALFCDIVFGTEGAGLAEYAEMKKSQPSGCDFFVSPKYFFQHNIFLKMLLFLQTEKNMHRASININLSPFGNFTPEDLIKIVKRFAMELVSTKENSSNAIIHQYIYRKIN